MLLTEEESVENFSDFSATVTDKQTEKKRCEIKPSFCVRTDNEESGIKFGSAWAKNEKLLPECFLYSSVPVKKERKDKWLRLVSLRL